MRKLGYQNVPSWFHRLYPITKLAWLFFGSVIVFLPISPYTLIAASIGLIIGLLLVDQAFFTIRGVRLSFITALFLFILHLLFNKAGEVIFNAGIPFLRITTGGLEAGIMIAGRFLTIVLISYLFVITTDPSDLAYTLMRAGLPYRWGFMFVTALRLAPIMEEEGRTIYRAQLARGIQYDQHNIKKLLLLIQQFMSPLLTISFRKVDKLVFSMEGRGFGKSTQRSFYKTITPTYLDIVAIIILIMLLIFVFR